VAAAKADYYEVLGVARDADGEAIQTAFHTAARDVHPDVSDAPEAEERFRELAEAYIVLSKPASRLLYDRHGYRGRGSSGLDEALLDAREADGIGESIHLRLELRAAEAEDGTSRLVRFEAARPCDRCAGRGTTGDVVPDCPRCGGKGRVSVVSELDSARFLRVEPCPLCAGPACEQCGGSGREFVERRLQVRVPAGIETGTLLRVGGEGDAGELGGTPGDLLLDVVVLPEPEDRRALRYASLVLFVAAVALLVFELVFR
jgi:molecular chaperone DnaJ